MGCVWGGGGEIGREKGKGMRCGREGTEEREEEREKIRWKMGEGREMEREEKKNSMVEVEREDVRTYHQVEDSSV